ncbi:MAG TPA: hypothetical protein P5323_03990 [Candidatus Moranbacteria bacterium]|nr:hypothetical protein [Candidatus Moranbacteria bacterium]HSA08595.1 hypothetical protein [Candidatus Moranbacteria bacterium]
MNRLKNVYEKIKKYENKIWLLLLLVIAVISHWEWFHFGNVLSFEDTWFQSQETLKEAFFTNTWVGNSEFGMPNIQLYKLLFFALHSFLAKVGLQFTEVARITHFIPIAIVGFLAPFILIKHLTKEKSIAFVVAIFYGSTTPFIMRQYLGHSSIAFIIAIAPFILYIFSLALEKNTMRQWIIFVLLYWTGTCYEPRIMYVVTIVLGLYFLFFGVTSFKKYFSKIFLSLILFICLSAFWILPIILGSFSEAIGDVAGRDLFGNAHYSILKSLALFHDNWTGVKPLVFSFQPIPWYFWLIPALTVLFFIFRPNKKDKKIISFFGVALLIGLFLTKQAGPPLPDAFQWLRENVPGFLAFRSGSKFWFVLSLGYMGLLSFGLLWLKKRWHEKSKRVIFICVCVIIATLSLWNLKPLITGEFGGMFEKRVISNDYLLLKNFLIQRRDFSRTFWTPANSRWSFYLNEKPAISNIAISEADWKNFSKYEQNNKKPPIQDRITDILSQSFSDQLFDVSSIKYIIVPIQDIANDDDFFVSYGGEENPKIREWYITQLDKIDWLKKIDIGTGELVVYENENYRPHIYTTKEEETIHWEVPFEKVDFVQKNPTEYKISLKNLSKKTYLNFSESFHPDWKLRAGEFGWFSVLIHKDYFLPDEFHIKNNANLSTFKIDPEFIKKNYPNSYTENPDGSINVNLTLFFKPQSYFYLGLLISSETLLICLLYLGYCFLFKISQKEEEKLIKKDGTTIKKIQ